MAEQQDDMTPTQVQEVAAELKAYATHFDARDWNYTRDLGSLKVIRQDGPTDRLSWRLKHAAAELFGWRRRPGWLSVSRWRMALVMLTRDKNLPDGILDDGNVITYWEETGEYLQYVQPVVGALIAEWLAADAENPYAYRVAAEMRRIAARLGHATTTTDTDTTPEG